MRVALVTGHATGGVAGHVAELADGLGTAGVEAVVATSAVTAARWRRRGAVTGTPVHELWPDPRRPGSALRRVHRLRALLRSADVVHAHGHQAGLLTTLLLRGARGRRGTGPVLVVTWHNAVLGGAVLGGAAPGGAVPGHAGAGRCLRALAERVQARRADLLTGASGDLVARARALGARAPELTPVAVPDRAARGGRARGGRAPGSEARGGEARGGGAEGGPVPAGLEDLAPGTAVVLTVSRLADQKDLPTLVRAAARAATRAAGAGPLLWCVVGDGDPAVEQRVRRLAADLRAPVRLLGARDDVPDLLARADVFALSSAWEARSLAVQEAMAAGVPVVATRTGGLPDLLEGVGTLVPVGDDRALAAAVGALLDDAGAREAAGRAAREAFLALPGPADVLRGWTDRYARLVADGPRR